MKKNIFLVIAVFIALNSGCQRNLHKPDDVLIKAYNIDFNWGEGGPNGFAKPGLWADANPADHVNWYASLGCNVIQSFAVSCNGYAWYKNGIVPEQPGLKYDFLTEEVKLAHKKNIKVFGYFCAGSNTKWGQEHPDLSYGIPSSPHIPYTTQYLDYFCASIEDAIKKTSMDGVFIDWLWNPGATMEPYPPLKWIECEQVMYNELMDQPFPGKDKITPEIELQFRRKAIDRTWKRIRETVKKTKPGCIIWLTSCQLTSRDIAGSDMLKEVDWVLNEAGDIATTESVRGMLDKHTLLVTCLANWNKQDPAKIIPAAIKDKVGLYGFTKPVAGSMMPPVDYYLSKSVDSLKGDERNIAVLARVYNNLPISYLNHSGKPAGYKFQMPEDYLREPVNIPSFWLSTVDDVTDFLKKNVHKGQVEIIGTSAGGRPVHAVFYGNPRQGMGTTTFSGSLGFGDVCAYRGPDHKKTVYMGMAAVHGGEFEGIVGMLNLISVIETGKDLRGREWPEITANVAQLDRLILIPIVNPDGRARIPLRMEAYRETDLTVAEYLNTGGKPDGTITGWPQIKEFIPMDLNRPGFPGGYPNDAGVNIQHDNFLGKRQPETQALFDLTERERPDLIINMHTGAVYMLMDHPLGEPALRSAFDTLFKYVHSALALNGLQYTKDPIIEGNPNRASTGVYNLDGALNLHCGALSVVVESPSHAFSGKNRAGKPALQTPDMLLDAQLVCHQEAMRFLAKTGGRSVWTPGRKR